MSYSLNRGVDGDGLDNTQRGLLIGLPAIALILSFGAVHKHASPSPAHAAPATVPVVSTLSFGDGSSDNSSSSDGTGSSPQSAASVSSAATTPVNTSTASSPAPAPAGNGSGSTGVVGGMGGGPTGGTTLPDCSIGQIATVNCRVPACSPEVTLSPGQKAILGIGGTCVVLN